MQADNHFNFVVLRQRHPYFVFEDFNIRSSKKRIILSFHFHFNGEIHFKPEISFPKFGLVQDVDSPELRNIAFQVGMIEMISYWKAACSPQVIIKAGKLNDDQIDWWKKLYFLGLGEFFYLNNIATNDRDFMRIECEENAPEYKPMQNDLEERCLVPIGGGKDSVVSLHLLQQKKIPVQPMIVNPRGASLASCIVAGYREEDVLKIDRQIDPQLLALNRKQYLNGHTPFSASLAFNGMFAAMLQGFKFMALSNESSANEPTVIGTDINHQYSKSFEFEKDFRAYVKKYVHPQFEYFSFLRPLNEYGITRIFAGLQDYHPIFKSCNVGSKKDQWCCNCPKCLFTYIMLSAHLKDVALEEIFGENLLDNEGLKGHFKDLLGMGETKPFECVGTVAEVKAALSISARKYPDEDYPALLKYFLNTSEPCTDHEIREVVDFLDPEHCLPTRFNEFLMDALSN